MPTDTVYEAVTRRVEILGPDGRIDPRLDPGLPGERLVQALRDMLLVRLLDERAVKLQRQGRLGTWGSLRGQEAAQVGLAMAMQAEDWLVPSFREHGLLILRGVPAFLVYAFWKGDERGGRIPEGVRCLPPSVPVGSQLCHAAGMGLALRLKGEPGVVVGCAGDGATSQGDFHEALNFAGVFRTATVFFIQNNQWAISLPFARQTAAASIAQKAHAYGLPGVQVDGNDLLAVYAAAREALERARDGQGPSLIEALTYRVGDHTTADEATRYRPPEELSRWAERDPVLRLGRHLRRAGLWDDQREAAWQAECQARCEQAVADLEAMPPQAPGELFAWMYAEQPDYLAEQREALEREARP